jgi:hypothetical protein
VSANHFSFLADVKPAKWLVSYKLGRGRVMPPKSMPTPETNYFLCGRKPLLQAKKLTLMTIKLC